MVNPVTGIAKTLLFLNSKIAVIAPTIHNTNHTGINTASAIFVGNRAEPLTR